MASYLVFVSTSTFIPSNITKLIHLKMMAPQGDLPDLQVSQPFVFGSVELNDFYSSLSGNSNPTSSPGTFFFLGAFCDGILAIIAFCGPKIQVAFTRQQKNRIEQRYRTPSPRGHLKQYARHSFAGKTYQKSSQKLGHLGTIGNRTQQSKYCNMSRLSGSQDPMGLIYLI